MWVIGTAGHVDHGKSTLVAALTGIHPDRLKEEKAREMTIELGFAWLTLPDGNQVGIVDVPGHRDFIENMLAGVGGIDAALFVVAADEGVMPQTREHLAILDILQIPAGVIALTKVDLVDDPDWLALVTDDIRQASAGTVLENAPLVQVSARTGAGLEALVQALTGCLMTRPPRPDLGRPRLPVDRVFTIAGFGTVVTGTLSDGRLKVGDEVELLPNGLPARIRGLQSHKQKVAELRPGNRAAVNISGLDVDQVRRGDVLALSGQYRATQRLDVHFRLSPDASAGLKHNAEVKFFIGASESPARLRLLGLDQLDPGQEAFLQLELAHPVVAVRGDRYILRRPSPGETLGGGRILEPHAARRHKRFDPGVLERMEALLVGSPADVMAQTLDAAGLLNWNEWLERSRVGADTAGRAVQELLDERRAVRLEGEGPSALFASADLAARMEQSAAAELRAFHRSYPLRRGMPREALKSRLKLPPRAYSAFTNRWIGTGAMREEGSQLALPDHQARFTPAQQAAVDQLLDQFRLAPYTPPSVKDVRAALGDEVYNALLEQNQLVQVSAEVVFRRQDYDQLIAAVREHFTNQETLSVSEFRDRFQTSRKYALAFLEHLDSAGLTVRSEDVRRLRETRQTNSNENR